MSFGDENQGRLPRAVSAIEQGRVAGLHRGAQLYVSLAGLTVANLALGERAPSQPMTDDTLLLWMSACKPVMAVALLQQVELERCTLDDRVARYIPEFAQEGKEPITLRHLLTHTGGFRWAPTGDAKTPWAETIDKICRARLEPRWPPGDKAGYHPYSSWYILGELIRRIDGRMPDLYARQEIFEPLGMRDCWLSLAPAQVAEYGGRIAPMYVTEKTPDTLHLWSAPTALGHCAPGATGRGPMGELAAFYEMLLGGGQRNGARVLQPDTVEQMISRQRLGMFDETFQQTIDWGWGVIVNSRRYGDDIPYGYGRYASAGTFGHSGNQSSVGMADPQEALVIALAFNGMPGEAKHQLRVRAVLDAVYLDLGLGH
ncbi:MAG: beta-lactamase family protein [Planctomycetes bacterium]|nr:beta-lactamase family protein [Planctomycetota bacterium]